MAGLGRGLSALLSQSAEKSARNADGKSTRVNRLLQRSLAHAQGQDEYDEIAPSALNTQKHLPQEAVKSTAAQDAIKRATAQEDPSNSFEKMHEAAKESFNAADDIAKGSKNKAKKSLKQGKDKHKSNLKSERKDNKNNAPEKVGSFGAEAIADTMDAQDASLRTTSSRTDESMNNVVHDLSIDKLRPSQYQPRTHFDEKAILELSESIATHGLLEPLLVKKVGGDIYEIICGERRFRAAKAAKLESVPCLIRDVSDDKGYAIALIENLQREDLNPVEMAIAIDQMMQECNMTQDDVAKNIGKSRSTVANLLRVLKLEDEPLACLRANKIDLGHAKLLLSLSGSHQVEACRTIIKKALSVRGTEAYIKELQQKQDKKNRASHSDKEKSKKSEDLYLELLSKLEKSVSDRLGGCKAKFKHQHDGKGSLVLSYSSQDELSNIIKALGLSVVSSQDGDVIATDDKQQDHLVQIRSVCIQLYFA